MEFDKFKSFAVSESFRGRDEYVHIVNSVERYINENEIKVFYPQNLFVEQKPLTLFVFRENDFWVFKYIDLSIEIAVYKYEKISSLILNQTTSYRPIHTLMVGLSTGEKFVFKGQDDTNNHHAHRFNENVALLFGYLAKLK